MLNEYTYKIGDRSVTVDLSKLSDEERAVLSLISFAGNTHGKTRITQREIMESERWLGAHPQHETNVKDPDETTLRQVRAIIRRLRIDHHVPILSDVKGYWIPENMAEVETSLSRLESTARAQARAWHETYQELNGCFQMAPLVFFEKQAELLAVGPGTNITV